jgi:hypothetical protein
MHDPFRFPASGRAKPAVQRPTLPQPNREATRWAPGPGLALAWIVLGGFLTVLGSALFATLYAATRGGSAEFSVRIADLAPLVATLVATILVLFATHELIHGVVIRWCGARPCFGVNLVARVLPALYTTAPGARFSRPQFVGVSLAPLLVVSVVGALLVVVAPFGGVLVLPLGIHVGGCVGDLWMVGLVLRQPGGTLIEDAIDGAIFLPPPAAAENGR